MRARSSWRRRQRTGTIPILPTTSVCPRRASAPRRRCVSPVSGGGPPRHHARAPMLAELKEFFSELVDGQKAQHQFAENRSEEHTSELQSPYVISYAVFCLKKT